MSAAVETIIAATPGSERWESEHAACAEAAVEVALSRVDEAAMRVALAGGCCARHVALGFAQNEKGAGPCGPLGPEDVERLTRCALKLRRDGYGAVVMGSMLVVLATLAGRMP